MHPRRQATSRQAGTPGSAGLSVVAPAEPAWRVGLVGTLFVLGMLMVLGGAVWQLAGSAAVASRGASTPTADAESTASGSPVADQPLRPDTDQGDRASRILHAWDDRRSAAWQAGDPRRLRRLYAPGSATAAVDVRRLNRWLRRGYAVRDLQTQVLRLRVSSHRPRRLVLTVTDRLVGGEAVGHGRVVRLPRDGPTRWRMTLARHSGHWLMQETRRL